MRNLPLAIMALWLTLCLLASCLAAAHAPARYHQSHAGHSHRPAQRKNT